MAIGDIVLIKDTNALRGHWKLGKVTQIEKGKDGRVRNCDISYKLIDENLHVPKKFTVVKRAVQNLVVILPIENDVNYDQQSI